MLNRQHLGSVPRVCLASNPLQPLSPKHPVDLRFRRIGFVQSCSLRVERLDRHVTISNEALALFVRFWLTATPPLPDTAQPAAQAKGRERYAGFVEALGRRLAKGASLAQEISRDIVPDQGSSGANDPGL